MKRIFKYPLAVEDAQFIRMPLGAEILTVQVQGGLPCLWALVNPDEASMPEREIRTFGTGHFVPDDCGKYVGTFQLDAGALVFHVFDKG